MFVLFGTYSAWIYTHEENGEIKADANVQEGMRLWREQNCQSCHQLYGLGGFMGPDLTNIHRTSDEGRMRTFIRYGTGRMPAHELSGAEIDELIAFLAWVDRSGTSKVPEGSVHWSGTYVIPAPR